MRVGFVDETGTKRTRSLDGFVLQRLESKEEGVVESTATTLELLTYAFAQTLERLVKKGVLTAEDIQCILSLAPTELLDFIKEEDDV